MESCFVRDDNNTFFFCLLNYCVNAAVTPMSVALVMARQCLWTVRVVSTITPSSTSCSTPSVSTMSSVAPTGTSTSESCGRTSHPVRTWSIQSYICNPDFCLWWRSGLFGLLLCSGLQFIFKMSFHNEQQHSRTGCTQLRTKVILQNSIRNNLNVILKIIKWGKWQQSH